MLSRIARSGGPFVVAVLLFMSMQTVAHGAPVLLFDQAHDQRFLMEQEGPLHLSRFAAVLKAEGFEVKAGTAPLTEQALTGVNVLVISGPFSALAPAETEAVMAFLARGGRLAVMLHIPSPVADLVHRLDVDFTNYVLSEQENVIEGDQRNFQIKNLVPHPLFGAIDHFSLYGGWALMSSGSSARVIALTSPKGWVDLNGDKKLSTGDVVQAFGVVADGTSGAGRFVVFGDDAIFQNKFLDQQNLQLAHNLANWLK